MLALDRPALAVALLLLACAADGSRRPVAPPAGPSAPLPRSTIAAVLAHRAELGLSAVEVERLEQIDSDLVRERREWGADAASGEAKAKNRSHGGEAPSSSDGASGGPGSGGLPAGPPGAPGASGGRGTAADPTEGRRRWLDEADTRAYLRAEATLEPPHRDGARRIASEYRAALYDLRRGSDRPPPG
jgi:hypothetical protein